MAKGKQVSWQPVTKNPQRLSYVDPIVVVGKHNKAYFSLVAEEKMGNPDEIVFLSGANGQRAVRPARANDGSGLRRKLDPSHSVTVPRSLLAPGHYRLRLDGDGLFRLLPVSASNIIRRLRSRTRKP